MPVPPLVFRIEKGLPVTPLEGDNNLRLLRNFANSLEQQIALSLNPDGTLKNPSVLYAESTTGTDTYVCAFSPIPANAAALVGKILVVKFTTKNTGPATLTPNTLGPFAIKKFKDQPLESDDIKAGGVYIFSYDGTNLELQSFPGVVQPINYALDSGLVNALVVNQAGWIQIPETLYAGYQITVKALISNTGASTLQVGPITATIPAPIAIKKNATQPLVAGDILANGIYNFVYDGTNFQVLTGGVTTISVTTGPAFKANRNGVDYLAFATATIQQVQFDVTNTGGGFDTGTTLYNTSTWRWLPGVAGYFRLHGKIKLDSGFGSVGAGTLNLYIYKNGASIAQSSQLLVDIRSNTIEVDVLDFSGTPGDYYECFAQHNSSGTRVIDGDVAYSYFEGHTVRSS